MAATDQRMSVLDIINEVRIKTKLDAVSTVAADSDSVTKLRYLNDVISEVSDYGNWQETLREFVVTAQSSVQDYSIPVSAVTIVQNVHEVVFGDDIGEMRKVDLDTIRRLSRLNSYGDPSQWGIVGTDSNSNPVIRVYPIPGSVQAGETFKVLAYQKPNFVTTSDGSTVPVFPGKLLVQGLLCSTILDESDGEATQRYVNNREIFLNMLDQSYNRYNGDTGSTVYFRPSKGRR